MTAADGRRARGRRLVVRMLMPLAVVGISGAFLADDGPGPVPLRDRTVRAALVACPDLAATLPGAPTPLIPGPAGVEVHTAAPAGGPVMVLPGGGVGAPRVLRVGRDGGRLALPPGPAASGGRTGAILVSAREGAAPGLSATVTAHGDGAGPARARCAPVTSRMWFAGPSTMAGRDPVLVVANLGEDAAEASVQGFTTGPAGPAQSLSVPAAGMLTRRLAAIAPESTATAFDVQVRAGRLLAWVTDRASRGVPFTAPRLVPATSSPARRLLLGGVARPLGSAGSGATLVLAAPERAATVRVSVLTAAGAQVPVGLAAVRVPAGSTTAVPVPLPVGAASAVLVESMPATAAAAGSAAPGAAPAGPAAKIVASLGVSSGWPGVWTWAGATWVDALGGGAGVDAYGRGVGMSSPQGPTAGAGTAPDAVVTVPAAPRGAAATVVLAAPLGPVTAWLDGTEVRLPAGTVAVRPAPAAPGGGRLTAVGGPLVATVVTGAPVAGAGPAALPRIVSAVVALSGAPRQVDIPATLADPAVGYR